MEWTDDRHARISFQDDDHWSLTIRGWGIPLLHPRLRLGRLGAAP